MPSGFGRSKSKEGGEVRNRQKNKIENRLKSKAEKKLSSVIESLSNSKQAITVRARNIQKTKWISFGIILGILISAYFAYFNQDVDSKFKDLQNKFKYLSGEKWEFMQKLPSEYFSEENITKIYKLLKSDEKDTPKVTEETFEPAKSMMRDNKLKPKHPVVLIPGVITSGLENWSTTGGFQAYFRKRIWGTFTMVQALLSDKKCWLKHMSLDPRTGMDPPGIRLRVAKGLEAADYFMTGYWLWSKIIENFSTVGYDNFNMFMASYDWRLKMDSLQARDKYFSEMKHRIEMNKSVLGEKTVLISHSMGGLVAMYFLNWVRSPAHGNGGENWVNDHIESWANLAGPLLGTPKAFSSLFSGEQKESVQPIVSYLLENYMSRAERAKLFRNWGSFSAMLPKGGVKVWGGVDSAPDDISAINIDISAKKEQEAGKGRVSTVNTSSVGSFGRFLNIYGETGEGELGDTRFLDVEQSLNMLLEMLDPVTRKNVLESNNFGAFNQTSEFEKHKYDSSTWINPLTHQLPNAKNMTIYNFYGVGIPAERGYHYKLNPKFDEQQNYLEDGSDVDVMKYVVNNNKNTQGVIESGITYSDGDGTVSLLSLGLMGAKGWKSKKYNPHGVKVVVRELPSKPVSFIKGLGIGGGAELVDHLGMLGNYELLTDLINIVTGNKTVSEKIYSNITTMVERIDL